MLEVTFECIIRALGLDEKVRESRSVVHRPPSSSIYEEDRQASSLLPGALALRGEP